MEILMKLKCSPSAGSPAHSTIKVVDHHQQLQQHTITPPPHMRAAGPQDLRRMPPCLEYARTPPMDCCSLAAAEAADMAECWEQQQRRRAKYAAAFESPYCGAYETPACCSGLTYAPVPAPPPAHSLPPPPLTHITAQGCANTSMVDLSMQYEYHEPEENFVSIDDAKIKGFLMKIGQAQSLQRDSNTTDIKTKKSPEVVYEIIELDDEEERKKLKRIKTQVEEAQSYQTQTIAAKPPPQQSNSPNISLIPKGPETETLPQLVSSAAKHKIIAQIELLDSSDSEAEAEVDNNANNAHDDEEEEEEEEEENDDDDEELPLAAAAVSCELDCEDDDSEEMEANFEHGLSGGDASCDDIVILNSDDENVDFIEKHEKGLELRWDDLEEQKERTFFECFLCGKKVQSSYNLRRHMMIHTGERPFGCDMCDRRFREFSDLKKHRRRHVNDANFVCMICRINTPTESDPTRCNNCDTKNGALIAAMRPQFSPDKSAESCQTPPAPIKKPPSRNLTPAPGATLTPPPPPGKSTPSPAPAATDVPTLVPLIPAAGGSNETQMLLDNIPAVHRPSYNQLGVGTRKEFPCPLCQRPFGTRHNLKRHFMIHTGEKPFSCSKCRKPFREYSTLKKHMVTHQRERLYKCLRCPKKYRDYLEYMEHKKSHAGEEDSSAGNSTAASPKKRARLRPGYDEYGDDSNDEDSSPEDWIECCECQQRFTDLESYTEHLKEHDPNVFLYECYICKRTFEERSELVQHVGECREEASVARSGRLIEHEEIL